MPKFLCGYDELFLTFLFVHQALANSSSLVSLTNENN